MPKLNHYVFRSIWSVDAPFEDVCAVLADVEAYPEWWPEIRGVKVLGDGRFEIVARSLLLYELRFVSEGQPEKASRGVIPAALSGDLEGFARWTVTEEPSGGCRVVYDQEVETHKKLLDVLAPVARPGFRANHSLMMRHGQAGLRTYLAGYTRGAGDRATS